MPRSTLLIASINMDKVPTLLFTSLYIMNTGLFQIDKSDKRQTRLRNGLVTRHAYSVTGLARVRGQLGDTHLVSTSITPHYSILLHITDI